MKNAQIYPFAKDNNFPWVKNVGLRTKFGRLGLQYTFWGPVLFLIWDYGTAQAHAQNYHYMNQEPALDPSCCCCCCCFRLRRHWKKRWGQAISKNMGKNVGLVPLVSDVYMGLTSIGVLCTKLKNTSKKKSLPHQWSTDACNCHILKILNKTLKYCEFATKQRLTWFLPGPGCSKHG